MRPDAAAAAGAAGACDGRVRAAFCQSRNSIESRAPVTTRRCLDHLQSRTDRAADAAGWRTIHGLAGDVVDRAAGT